MGKEALQRLVHGDFADHVRIRFRAVNPEFFITLPCYWVPIMASTKTGVTNVPRPGRYPLLPPCEIRPLESRSANTGEKPIRRGTALARSIDTAPKNDRSSLSLPWS